MRKATASNLPTGVTFSLGARMTVIMFALLVAVPLSLSLTTDHAARAQWEKRELATVPPWQGFKKAADYFSALSSFADDHMGLAVELNKFYRQLVFYVFRESPVANVSVGSDGFVFLNSHSPSRPNAIFSGLCMKGTDQHLLEERRAEFRKLFQLMEGQSFNTAVAVAVSKPVLHPENLPETVPVELRRACSTYGKQNNVSALLSRDYEESGQVFYYPYEQFASMREEPHFYPKENFHWHGRSAHEFARGLLAELGIEPGEAFSEGASIVEAKADLKILGFERQIKVWNYPYKRYGVTRTTELAATVRPFYERVRDVSSYVTASPLSQRRALLLTNSFGAFVARHLAPGFSELYHININHLNEVEYGAFFTDLIGKLQVTDVVFVIHDDELVKGFSIDKIVHALQANPDVRKALSGT